MKKIFLHSFFLLYPLFVINSQTPQIHITIHNDSTSSSNQTITKTDSIYDTYSSYFDDMYHNRHTLLQTTTTSCYDYIMSHKIKIGCMSLLYGYVYILYIMYRYDEIIDHPLAWNRWKSHACLEELMNQPQHKLEIDLLFMIQNYYTDPINPTNFIYSITQASIALEKEIRAYELQKNLYQYLQSLQATSLFFITQEMIDDLDKKHQKVLFMKYIFSSWCTQYKIEKNR